MLRPLGLVLGIAGAALATASVAEGPSDDVRGPQRLCFKYSSLDLTADEHVTGVAMGIEGMLVGVAGKRGAFDLRESEIFAEPVDHGALVQKRPDARIYLEGDPQEPTYSIYGRSSFSPNQDRRLLVLSGNALRDEASARAILGRIRIGTPKPEHCDHRYSYGWEYFLPDSLNQKTPDAGSRRMMKTE